MKKIRLLGTVVIVLLFSLMALGSMDQKEEKKSDTNRFLMMITTLRYCQSKTAGSKRYA